MGKKPRQHAQQPVLNGLNPLIVRELAVERAQVDLERLRRLFLVTMGRGEYVLDILALLLLEEALERSVRG